MTSSHVLRLGAKAFNASTVCLGSQLAELIEVISQAAPALAWHVADISVVSGSVHYSSAIPALVGDAATLIRTFKQVDQFDSGVFVGVPAHIARPAFREGGLWTEDNEPAPLGESVIELRAFDTSYWFVATSDPEIEHALRARFET